LLRDKGIRIGVNKDDFERNLSDAIETGQLRLKDVDGWLERVEGWGNQHVYLYNISSTLREDLMESDVLRDRVRKSGYEEVWEAPTVLEFPDEPRLTSISFTASVLRVVWQESAPSWTPVPEKNYQKEEGLDIFEYRAFRMVEQRAITRFEAHLDTGLAGLFIANPIQGSEHQTAIDEAKRVIGQLMELSALEAGQIDISVVSRNLDQENVPTNVVPRPEVKTQKSRLASGGAYVEFAATSRDRAYWEEPAVHDVRQSVRAAQLTAFQGTDGVFIFQLASTPQGSARPLRVQLYGKNDRIRLWAQMNATEVWAILEKLSRYQQTETAT
jgi:hypothetical protein